MVLWAWHSDRTGERTWHVVIACLFGSRGPVLLPASRLAWPVCWWRWPWSISASALPSRRSGACRRCSCPARRAAAGIAAINSIGNLGGFVGPAMIGCDQGLDRQLSAAGFISSPACCCSRRVLTLLLARSEHNEALAARRAAGSISSRQPRRSFPCANIRLPRSPATASAPR